MKLTQNFIATLCMILSICGVLLIIIITTFSSNIQDVFWRKPILGTLFGVECILGILAGLFPLKCSGLLHFGKSQSKNQTMDSEETFQGHHPRCGQFKDHVINFRGKIFCAGCTGLIIGAIFSLSGVILYFFLEFNLSSNMFFPFWIGAAGVTSGLLQYHLFNWGGSIVHLLINVYFVFGTFLLLIAIDAITENWVIDLYLIIISVFWIITRVVLSQRDHKQMCTICSIDECVFH